MCVCSCLRLRCVLLVAFCVACVAYVLHSCCVCVVVVSCLCCACVELVMFVWCARNVRVLCL